MLMKKLIASSMFLFLLGAVSFAQQEITQKCGTYNEMEKVFEMYPELGEQYYAHELLKNSQEITYNKNGEKSIAYTIPVVFHILHEYGNENISDAQVYDAMRVINREFNNEDPDSVDIVAEYTNMQGDANITFKLAALDPFGNCTNGIEHIYSHETRSGDAFSKISQWNRARYLNIWVVEVVGQPGAAAYAIKPAGTDGTGFWLDGIVSNHTYVGSTGTSSVFNESTLTHEIGHYLSLDHTWGPTNDPEVACGDDGVPDTPITRGHSAFNCLGTYAMGAPANGNPWSICDTTVVEDCQNYMEYSYCDRHFTPNQCEFMINALNEIAGQRSNLWQDSTLLLTGVKDLLVPQDPSDQLTVPLCTPVADYTSNTKNVCVGELMNFSDASWNATIDSWEWTFEDGSPATSSNQNPVVSFNSAGYKTVTLSVTNAAGTGTETRTGYIYVSNLWGDFTGPRMLDMEDNYVNWFIVNNPEDNHAKFEVSNGTGYDGSRSWKLNNYKDVANADLFNDDYFYYNRLGLSEDMLITPSFDLRNTSNVEVSFKYSYATNATQVDQIEERLLVRSSKDCGETWQTRKTIFGAPLVTGGYAGYADYEPVSNDDWETSSFTYTPDQNDEHTRFMFVFEASDLSSNLYIDDINVTGTLSLVSDEIALLDLNVYPNPTSTGQAISVSYTAQNEPVTFNLRDAQGKLIATEVIEQTNAMVNQTLKGTENLRAAPYFLEVISGEHTTTRKVVVL